MSHQLIPLQTFSVFHAAEKFGRKLIIFKLKE